ncbi:carbohydrate-binding module family 13 protein [Panus rudis PR-1116 ss-1]|nr:carbohydrate-binding module family 13 protein [Panus rudis PR-1116 ss-1]
MAQIQSGATYKLVNAKAHNVLDLSGGDNRSIIGYDWHGGDNQKWQVSQSGSGWVFRNVGTGLYLRPDIGGGNLAENGTPVIADSEPFEWDIWPDEQDPSVFRIFVPNTPQNVDLSDHGNATPGTRVTLWWKWDGRNQCWHFEQGERRRFS